MALSFKTRATCKTAPCSIRCSTWYGTHGLVGATRSGRPNGALLSEATSRQGSLRKLSTLSKYTPLVTPQKTCYGLPMGANSVAQYINTAVSAAKMRDLAFVSACTRPTHISPGTTAWPLCGGMPNAGTKIALDTQGVPNHAHNTGEPTGTCLNMAAHHKATTHAPLASVFRACPCQHSATTDGYAPRTSTRPPLTHRASNSCSDLCFLHESPTPA